MVDNGDVRHEDFIGNSGADTAADLGRLRQKDSVIAARRALIRVRRHWYLIMLELHKVMVPFSRIESARDGYGGTALDTMIWDFRVVFLNPESLLSRASWITPHSQVHLDFWTALGVA